MGKTKKVKVTDPESLKEAGNRAFMNKRFDEAIEMYTSAIKLDGKNNIYYSNRANAYLEEGQFEEALADCNKSIELAPDFAKAYVRKAKAELGLQKYDEALVSMKAAVAKDSSLAPELKEFEETAQNEKKLDNLVPATSQERVNYAKFLQNITENGVEINKCKTRWTNPQQRFIVATSYIPKGNIIASVPYNQWITIEKAIEKSPLCEKLNVHVELMSKLSFPWMNTFYAIFLMEVMKSKDSEYQYFIDSLPLDLSNYPMTFGAKEKDLLKGSQLLDNLKERTAEWQADYDLICQKVPEVKDTVSFEKFKEAKILVSNRAYNVTYNDGSIKQVLLPFVDMAPINYEKEANVETAQVDGCIKFRSTRDIQTGDIIVQMQNKTACNSQVFLSSGFLCKNNDKLNKLQLGPIGIPSDTVHYDYKIKLLGSCPKEHVFELNKKFNQKATQVFLSWLRYQCYDQETQFLDTHADQCKQVLFDAFKKQNDPNLEFVADKAFDATRICPLAIDQETNVLKKAQQIILEKLLKFPTTLKQDEEKLAKGGLSYTEQNILELLIGEKKTCKWFIDMFAVFQKLMAPEIKDLKIFDEAVDKLFNEEDKELASFYTSCLRNLVKERYCEANGQEISMDDLIESKIKPQLYK